MKDLSHVDESGAARMVDISDKSDTRRLARATGTITMSRETFDAIEGNRIAKGDVLAVARIAGIMAAKRTPELVPLCHPISLTDIAVDFDLDAALPGVRVLATVTTIGKTGVEMEALTAAAVALLTIYDMAKAMDKRMVIGNIEVTEKTGGKSTGG